MLKKRFKITALVVVAVLITLTMAGCGAPPKLTKPQMTEDAKQVKVEGSCDIAIDGDVITVSGTTNLMDGAVIHVSVMGQNGMMLDSQILTKNGDEISQSFSITSDKYDESVTSVQGFITCAPAQYGQQPPAVYDTYGKKFENIDAAEDSIVWNTGGIIVLFASDMIDLPK